MELGELIEGLGVQAAGDARRVRICDLTEDSRTVVPGSLFVARAGLKADGKQYAAQAARAGAVAILTDDPGLREVPGHPLPVLHAPDVPLASALIAERFYGRPTKHLRLVGVTGTNGKTTISSLVWQLLNGAGVRCGLIGTVLVDDGVEVARAEMTTPPATELSRTMSVMVESGCRAASMEVSSHALDQKRVDGLRFEVGVFSNLTGDHLDYHKTMERYAAAKARLFELLPREGRAVVSASDPWSGRMTRDCRAPVWTTAVVGDPGWRETKADCVAEIERECLDGMDLALEGPWGRIAARVPLIGRYNAMNVLQAAAAAHALGLSAGEIGPGLSRVSAPPGRLEPVHAPGDGVAVFVDYAHSDDSLRNVLATVGAAMPGRGAPGGPRLWAVFGCGGDRDRTKRPRMGRAAAELADVAVVTSDNPRTEQPAAIIDEILAGIPASHRDRVTVQTDRARAIAHAVASAAAGDVIVIAGKGHETEQILPDGRGGTIKTHFDDREVARAALEVRRRGG